MSGRGGRPALEIDEYELRRLRAEGWGYERLAEHFGVSRSTIRRRVLGLCRSRLPVTALCPSTTADGRPYTSALLRRAHRQCDAEDLPPDTPRRTERERETAQLNLSTRKPSDARDVEFVLATWLLDRLLDEASDLAPWQAASRIEDELRAHVSARTTAEGRDRSERRTRAHDAKIDIGDRWRAEADLLRTRLEPFAHGERRRLDELLRGEGKRAETLVARRLEALPLGDDWRALVDHLVEKGIERAEDAFERTPEDEADES